SGTDMPLLGALKEHCYDIMSLLTERSVDVIVELGDVNTSASAEYRLRAGGREYEKSYIYFIGSVDARRNVHRMRQKSYRSSMYLLGFARQPYD
ncbi:MAG: hypothetical protein IJO13_05055, partial [Lachnospiraceae bacterium]|nr:hypothetical protein [Lachnospiraceae bacterium]